jgi:hypothetical protein
VKGLSRGTGKVLLNQAAIFYIKQSQIVKIFIGNNCCWCVIQIRTVFPDNSEIFDMDIAFFVA